MFNIDFVKRIDFIKESVDAEYLFINNPDHATMIADWLRQLANDIAPLPVVTSHDYAEEFLRVPLRVRNSMHRVPWLTASEAVIISQCTHPLYHNFEYEENAKVAAIKYIRILLSVGLAEAKDVVDHLFLEVKKHYA